MQGIGRSGIRNDENTVHVIGHNDPGIQQHRKSFGQALPDLLRDSSCGIELHRAVDYLTKQVSTSMGADGDEIGPRLAIIIVFHSGRTTTGQVCIGWHRSSSSTYIQLLYVSTDIARSGNGIIMNGRGGRD